MGKRRLYFSACLLLGNALVPATSSAQQTIDPSRVAEAPSVPECDNVPRNGEVIFSRGLLAQGGHAIEIDNGARGNAIIKVRDASTGALVLSFYLSGNGKATIPGIPDGDYKVQFATGDKLDLWCDKFVELKWAEEFPGTQRFRTERTATQIITSVLSYTLYEVSGGNVSPQTISTADFERP